MRWHLSATNPSSNPGALRVRPLPPPILPPYLPSLQPPPLLPRHPPPPTLPRTNFLPGIDQRNPIATPCPSPSLPYFSPTCLPPLSCPIRPRDGLYHSTTPPPPTVPLPYASSTDLSLSPVIDTRQAAAAPALRAPRPAPILSPSWFGRTLVLLSPPPAGPLAAAYRYPPSP